MHPIAFMPGRSRPVPATTLTAATTAVAPPSRNPIRLFVALLMTGIAPLATMQAAHASCGLSFCVVNTNWSLHGPVAEPGLRLDVRYEFVDQDQPLTGSRKLRVGEMPAHHDEVRTVDRNLVSTFDYTFDAQWGISAVLPFVDADHRHIHNHHGTPIGETWDFTRLGDVRVLGRYQTGHEDHAEDRLAFVGLNFGLKLPTGRRDIRNADGALAERSLQPGSGTTDLLVGAFFSQVLPDSDSSWFVQGLVQAPLGSRDGFRPGNRATIDVGYRYEASDNLGLMVQLNTLFKRADRGTQAEPENTGGRFIHLSPGLSYSLTRQTQIYGFVQLPLHRRVRGVQLVSDWGAVVGVTARF